MRRLVGLLLATAVLVGLAPLPAQAEDPVRMVFVLDSSGSMKEKTPGGEVKIDAAKKALNQVVGQIPSNFAVGLRLFGAKVFSRDDKGSFS